MKICRYAYVWETEQRRVDQPFINQQVVAGGLEDRIVSPINGAHSWTRETQSTLSKARDSCSGVWGCPTQGLTPLGES